MSEQTIDPVAAARDACERERQRQADDTALMRLVLWMAERMNPEDCDCDNHAIVTFTSAHDEQREWFHHHNCPRQAAIAALRQALERGG